MRKNGGEKEKGWKKGERRETGEATGRGEGEGSITEKGEIKNEGLRVKKEGGGEGRERRMHT